MKKNFNKTVFKLPKRFRVAKKIKYETLVNIFKTENNNTLTLRNIQSIYNKKEKMLIPLETLRCYMKKFLGARYTKIKIKNTRSATSQNLLMKNYFIDKFYQLKK